MTPSTPQYAFPGSFFSLFFSLPVDSTSEELGRQRDQHSGALSLTPTPFDDILFTSTFYCMCVSTESWVLWFSLQTNFRGSVVSSLEYCCSTQSHKGHGLCNDCVALSLDCFVRGMIRVRFCVFFLDNLLIQSLTFLIDLFSVRGTEGVMDKVSSGVTSTTGETNGRTTVQVGGDVVLTS